MAQCGARSAGLRRGFAGCAADLLDRAVARVSHAAGLSPVILSAWFLGMWCGVPCAVAEAILIDLYLARTPAVFPNGNVKEGVRLTFFLLILMVISRGMRRLAQQRTQLRTQELQQRLMLAQAEGQLAEQRTRISEELQQRDELLRNALEVNGMGLWVCDCWKARPTAPTRCTGSPAVKRAPSIRSPRRGCTWFTRKTWRA